MINVILIELHHTIVGIKLNEELWSDCIIDQIS